MKLAIENSENIEIVNSLISYCKTNNIEYFLFSGVESLPCLNFDLLVLTSFSSVNLKYNKSKVLAIHPSLLPAFAEDDAIVKAFTSGIKVTGVTIYEMVDEPYKGRIFAQYPVLLGITTNYSDYVSEMVAVAKKLYPAVIESIINDKVFDFSDLFKTSCHSGNKCGGCSCSKSDRGC